MSLGLRNKELGIRVGCARPRFAGIVVQGNAGHARMTWRSRRILEEVCAEDTKSMCQGFSGWRSSCNMFTCIVFFGGAPSQNFQHLFISKKFIQL